MRRLGERTIIPLLTFNNSLMRKVQKMNITRRELLRAAGWASAGLATGSLVQPTVAQDQSGGKTGLGLCIALNYENIDRQAYAGMEVPTLDGCLPDRDVMTKILHRQD